MKPKNRRKKAIHVGQYVLMIKRGTYWSIKSKPDQLTAVHDAHEANNSGKVIDRIIVARIYHVISTKKGDT